MQLVRAEISSFRGGMVDSTPIDGYAPDESPLIVNGFPQLNGRCVQRGGTRRSHSSALTGVSGTLFQSATHFWTQFGQSQRIAIYGDTAYMSEDRGETWTQIATGLTTAHTWDFASFNFGGNTWLYASNGGLNTYRWRGITPPGWDVAPGVPGNVRFLAFFNERLYAAGHDGPTIQASAIGNPEDFTVPNGLVISIQQDIGDKHITALSQVGPVLLVFTIDSTAYVSGVGRSDLITATGGTGVSRTVGCLSHRTIAPVGNQGAMWLSNRGIEYFTAGSEIQLISSPKLAEFFGDPQMLYRILVEPGAASAIYLADRNQYWLAIQHRKGGVLGRTLVIYDFTAGNFTTHEFTSRLAGPSTVRTLGCLVAAFREASLPEIDGQNVAPEALGLFGWYRYLDDGVTDDADFDGSNGLPIEMRVRSQPFTFANLFARKRARQIRVSGVANTEATGTVTVLANGQPQTPHSVTIPAAAGDQPRRSRHTRVNGRGDTLQVEFTTEDAVELTGLELRAEPMREP